MQWQAKSNLPAKWRLTNYQVETKIKRIYKKKEKMEQNRFYLVVLQRGFVAYFMKTKARFDWEFSLEMWFFQHPNQIEAFAGACLIDSLCLWSHAVVFPSCFPMILKDPRSSKVGVHCECMFISLLSLYASYKRPRVQKSRCNAMGKNRAELTQAGSF